MIWPSKKDITIYHQEVNCATSYGKIDPFFPQFHSSQDILFVDLLIVEASLIESRIDTLNLSDSHMDCQP
jgi:hypothetical protein